MSRLAMLALVGGNAEFWILEISGVLVFFIAIKIPIETRTIVGTQVINSLVGMFNISSGIIGLTDSKTRSPQILSATHQMAEEIQGQMI
jgi:hypothetical protein